MKAYWTAVLLAVLLTSGPLTLSAQAQGRRTPIGVQQPMPGPPGPPVPPPQGVPETPVQAVTRALAAHGNAWATDQIKDWVAEGTLTYFTAAGPEIAFSVTVLRKGDRQVQRIVKQNGRLVKEGSDGIRNWLSAGGFSGAPMGTHVVHFLESQTVRSVHALFKNQARGLVLRDAAVTNNEHGIEAEDSSGRKTRYIIDAKTSAVTRVEFVTGQSKDPFSGNFIADTETYRFSDLRNVQGLLTPFKIERFINGLKVEEMNFSSVSYNVSLKDAAFRP